MYSYFGLCPNAKESLILFEAVKRGIIPTVTDRLSEEQRKEIVSGAIYIWDERQNPMRRWTDGMTWSNSRVVGDFLEYRESFPDPMNGRQGKYSIKPYGLRKRSICLPAHENSNLRLIAYFSYSDLKMGKLIPPSENPAFADIVETLEKNPHLDESLALLASGKRRKRTKYLKYGKFDKPDVPSPPPSPHDIITEPKAAPYINTLTTQQHRTSNFEEKGEEIPPSQRTSLNQQQANNSEPWMQNASYVNQSQPSPPSFGHNVPFSTAEPAVSVNMPHLSGMSHYPNAVQHFTANYVLRSNILPSPVWIPLVMNSEDRRALQLLNTTNQSKQA